MCTDCLAQFWWSLPALYGCIRKLASPCAAVCLQISAARGRPAFREYAVFFHDELEIRTRDGGQPVDPPPASQR